MPDTATPSPIDPAIALHVLVHLLRFAAGLASLPVPMPPQVKLVAGIAGLLLAEFDPQGTQGQNAGLAALLPILGNLTSQGHTEPVVE